MATETLYYLFSTSAQVMAALAGLFGVFAIYAIQEFSDIFLSARGTARGAVFAGYERTSSGEKTWEDILLMSDEELFIDFTRLLNELPTAAVRSGMANEYDFNEKKRD